MANKELPWLVYDSRRRENDLNTGTPWSEFAIADLTWAVEQIGRF
jgi:hypothetical protein